MPGVQLPKPSHAATAPPLNPALSQADLETRANMLLGLYSGFRIMARSGVDVGKLRPGIEVALEAVR